MTSCARSSAWRRPARRPRPPGRRRLGHRRARRPSTTGDSASTLVDNVAARRPTHGDRRRLAAGGGLRRSRCGVLDVLRRDLERPGQEPLVTPPSPRSEACPTVRSGAGSSAEQYRQAVEVAKEYIRAGDAFQIVLSQRFDLDLGCRPVRRLPGAAAGEPEPVHVLPPPRGRLGRRRLPRAARPAPGWPGDLAADRRHTPARVDRRGGPQTRGRARRAPEGARRARHARRPRPQRRRTGRALRHRAGRRADDRSSATAT